MVGKNEFAIILWLCIQSPPMSWHMVKNKMHWDAWLSQGNICEKAINMPSNLLAKFILQDTGDKWTK